MLFGCVFEEYCGRAEDLIQARYNVPSHCICVSLSLSFLYHGSTTRKQNLRFRQECCGEDVFPFSACFPMFYSTFFTIEERKNFPFSRFCEIEEQHVCSWCWFLSIGISGGQPLEYSRQKTKPPWLFSRGGSMCVVLCQPSCGSRQDASICCFIPLPCI